VELVAGRLFSGLSLLLLLLLRLVLSAAASVSCSFASVPLVLLGGGGGGLQLFSSSGGGRSTNESWNLRRGQRPFNLSGTCGRGARSAAAAFSQSGSQSWAFPSASHWAAGRARRNSHSFALLA